MNQTNNRILFIDLCRGILVMMMTVRHTISILDISQQSWLNKFFIPNGWATVCFISLSGFSIGLLYLGRLRDLAIKITTSQRLRKRSWQLLVVMFLSNLFMLLGKIVVQGDISTLRDIEWWIGLITLKTPYSISSILIPTAILVYIAPIVLKAIIQYKVLPVLSGSLVLSFFIAVLTTSIFDQESNHYLLQRLLFEGDGFFPILPMVMYGVICISIGALWQKHSTQIILVSVIGYYFVVFLYSEIVIARVAFAAISGPTRLIIIIFICTGLLRLKMLHPLNSFFATIGRFSLLSFLLHRIILQAMNVVLGIIDLPFSIELLVCAIVFLNLVCLWLACLSRLCYPKWNTFLRSIYL